jgi:ACGX-repeat protein
MALSNLYGWNQSSQPASACGTACGSGDKPQAKSTACGSACGSGDKK